MGLSWAETIILGIIPLGQLYARIFELDGSLDKKIFLLPFFMFPPLSFIPLIMMKLGLIKKGRGGKPYDYWMVIPPLLKILAIMIVSQMRVYPPRGPRQGFPLPMNTVVMINLGVSFVAILGTYLFRSYKLCDGLDTGNFLKSLFQTFLSQGVAGIFGTLIKYVPFVGMFIKVLEMLPVVGDNISHILWSLGFFMIYILINMFNADSMGSFCQTTGLDKNTVVSGAVGLVLIIMKLMF